MAQGADAAGWNERTMFVGFDWASDHHDVVAVDQHGKIVVDFRFDDTADGWQQLVKKLSGYSAPAVVIETCSGAAVERLLEAGYTVYPVNPKAAKRYRERKAPCGTNTDHMDAWSLADALRLDGHPWRPLKPDDPLTVELRILCRYEIALIEQRTALICQLRAALGQYHPIVLRAFDDWMLRGYKGQVYEGGIRIPFLMQWHGRVPAGRTYEQPVVSLDIHATALAAAGIPVRPEMKLEGTNLVPFLHGKKDPPHEVLYWRFGRQLAVRKGDWKAVARRESAPQLFNLDRDIGEQTDLAAKEPERLKELQAAYEKWNRGNLPAKWRRSGRDTK